jgi:hypothetical protein
MPRSLRSFVDLIRTNVGDILVSLLLGALVGLAAKSVGNNWQIVPVSTILFLLFSLFLSYTTLHPDGRLMDFILWSRQAPMGMRLLTIAFCVTSLFAAEMKFDIVPDRFGFLELVMPVILSYYLGDLICAFFALCLVSFFAYYVFVPPKFSIIFEPGPSFDALTAFVIVCVSIIVWMTIREKKLFQQTKILLDDIAQEEIFTRLELSVRDVIFKPRFYLPLALVLGYTLFWSLYGAISAGNGLHVDSLEAYAWGREFQLGYFKHPPFWSWVAGLWFLIFPKFDFFFFFLSEFNAALGLLGAWMLLGRFCKGTPRILALALLLLTPFYQFNALRFMDIIFLCAID